eukprot:TRINITY_DN1631_c0_g1_i8.p1 TRINITY_DN1631_c0_g1~~TRINITY_DN1631_c0_g1_i8.p1  ORF type:complete len:293 (-),score=50.62 TRINITY_DN1631_c0_g1_i8:1135-2013(-)
MSFCHSCVYCAVMLCLTESMDVDNHARQIAAYQRKDSLPLLEVSLDPPVVPYPEVSQTIGSLDATREHAEAANSFRLLDAYRFARKHAKQRIAYAVGNVMRNFDDQVVLGVNVKDEMIKTKRHGIGFLSLGGRSTEPTFSFRVGVADRKNADPNVDSDLKELESKREASQNRSVDQAIESFSAITDSVVNELEAQLRQQLETASNAHGGASFLGTDGKVLQQAIVKVVPSSTFPTIHSLVDDMGTRRDLMEDLDRAHVLELQLQLMKDENSMIKEALETAVGRILTKVNVRK